MKKLNLEIRWKDVTNTNKQVVDDITVKHTVLDSINARLGRIDQSLIGIQINQGKTIREAELEETVEKQRNELAGAYRIIEEQKAMMAVLRDGLADATKELESQRPPWQFLNDGLMETRGCGGSNSYTSIKVGVRSHAEMTTTVRTNLQEIANGNGTLDQYGYMWGKWIKKNADSYFLSGLFKALAEGEK